jgi:general secretion pathway protein G
MKIYSGNIERARKGAQQGFTLIEMIGVLAVIAILAAVLIPKVFEAINNARVNQSAMSINGIKTGTIDHYAKYGALNVNGAAAGGPATFAAPQYGFDNILLLEQLIDKPFQVKIGDGVPEKTPADNTTTRIELIAAPAATGANVTAAGDGLFNLAGGTSKDDISGTFVVEAVITGVTLADAQALNKAIDGTSASMGETAATGNDFQGRVVYIKPAAAGGTTTVYVYLTHR